MQGGLLRTRFMSAHGRILLVNDGSFLLAHGDEGSGWQIPGFPSTTAMDRHDPPVPPPDYEINGLEQRQGTHGPLNTNCTVCTVLCVA